MKKTSSVALIAAAAAGVATGAAVASIFLRPEKSKTSAAATSCASLPPAMISEQLSRNTTFWGEKLQKKIESAFVVVVGLGGVGSHAAHMLIRSGVRKIRIVDFDLVTLSSLNRHAVADHADVGLFKAQVLKEKCARFAPFCEIEVMNEEFNAKTAENILSGNPDFVLDCIDDVKTKAILLAGCHAKKLRVVASMGAGGIVDPTRIHIADITDIRGDPLANSTMQRLRDEHGLDVERKARLGIPAVYSSEQGRVDLLQLTEEQRKNPESFGVKSGFRLRIMPVLGTMPAMFGMAMATFVLSELAGRKMSPVAIERVTLRLRSKMCQKAMAREKKVFGVGSKADSAVELPQFDALDVAFLLESVWMKRDSLTLRPMGCGAGSKFIFTRWDQSKPASRSNLVLVSTWIADALKASFKGMPEPKVLLKGGKAKGSDSRVDLTQETIDRVNATLSAVEKWQI